MIKKRKNSESEPESEIGQSDILPPKRSRDTVEIDLGDAGNTMEESSDTDSDDDKQKKKILKKFRKKLAANNDSDTTPERELFPVGNDFENELESIAQNPLGDTYVQNLIFEEEMKQLESIEKSANDQNE